MTIDWSKLESQSRISRGCSAAVNRKRQEGIEPSITPISSSKHQQGNPRDFVVPANYDSNQIERSIEVFKATGRITTQVLRIHLGMGGAQAIRLMDKLEYLGIVSPHQANRKRLLLQDSAGGSA